MGFYENLIKEIEKITIFQWIRLGLCSVFTYLTWDVILTRLVYVESTRFSLDIYHLATLFNETNKTSAMTGKVIDFFGDSYLYVVSFYFIVILFINIVVWGWFGMPKKILKR